VILSCSSLFVDIATHFAHGAFKIKIQIGLLSENVQESIIGGLGLLLSFILVCKANVTMCVVKYHSSSILHAQMDWHRGNIHCSYFLVFVEITVEDLKGGRKSLWNLTLNVQQVSANYGMISRSLWSSVNKHSNR
jgi:hypothetical protein